MSVCNFYPPPSLSLSLSVPILFGRLCWWVPRSSRCRTSSASPCWNLSSFVPQKRERKIPWSARMLSHYPGTMPLLNIWTHVLRPRSTASLGVPLPQTPRLPPPTYTPRLPNLSSSLQPEWYLWKAGLAQSLFRCYPSLTPHCSLKGGFKSREDTRSGTGGPPCPSRALLTPRSGTLCPPQAPHGDRLHLCSLVTCPLMA